MRNQAVLVQPTPQSRHNLYQRKRLSYWISRVSAKAMLQCTRSVVVSCGTELASGAGTAEQQIQQGVGRLQDNASSNGPGTTGPLRDNDTFSNGPGTPSTSLPLAAEKLPPPSSVRERGALVPGKLLAICLRTRPATCLRTCSAICLHTRPATCLRTRSAKPRSEGARVGRKGGSARASGATHVRNIPPLPPTAASPWY